MTRPLRKRLSRSFRIVRDLSLYGLGLRRPAPKRFVILCRGRSGSTAFVSILGAVPGIHCDGEILHDRVPLPERYVEARSAAKGAEAYGFKVLAYQIQRVQRLSDRDGFIRRLHARGFEVIHLSRANVFEHAVSGLRARRFGFHRRRGDVSSSERFEIDFETLLARMQEIERSRVDEARLLEGVPHLSLVYEEDLRDEARHQATLDRVCDALGLESARAHSAFGKVSPKRLRDSISNYDEIERRLAATPWARFLEGS